MPCGCTQNKNGQPTQWVHTLPDGRQQTFSSEVQAKAAKIRAGNTGTVTPR